jgi:PKHD-type hydroxylase
MIFSIPQLLSPEQLQYLTDALATAEFVNGKVTAGWYAKQVKHNQQLAGQGDKSQELQAFVKNILHHNPLFQTATRPRAIHSILFSRYEIGMSYGRHTDNALMGPWRSDISFTVFLSTPQGYGGGELVVEEADDERAYKLEAGSAIVYPASTLHRVEPVTEGTRLVAVGWVQSWVRDAHCREILFDLETARRSLFAQQGKTEEFDLISKSLTNLLRQWAE